MKYDKRLEARTRIGELRLDIKGDLNHTEARYSTLQTRVMLLHMKIKRNHLILTEADKGNTIVVMDKGDYTKRVESYILANGYTS